MKSGREQTRTRARSTSSERRSRDMRAVGAQATAKRETAMDIYPTMLFDSSPQLQIETYAHIEHCTCFDSMRYFKNLLTFEKAFFLLCNFNFVRGTCRNGHAIA